MELNGRETDHVENFFVLTNNSCLAPAPMSVSECLFIEEEENFCDPALLPQELGWKVRQLRVLQGGRIQRFGSVPLNPKPHKSCHVTPRKMNGWSSAQRCRSVLLHVVTGASTHIWGTRRAFLKMTTWTRAKRSLLKAKANNQKISKGPCSQLAI